MSASSAKPFHARAVLAFEAARVPAPKPGAPSLDIDFRLMEGEIAWIRSNRRDAATALFDAACGLLPPAAGAVRFAGLDWRDLGREQAGALRGRIGRLLPFDLWTPHLSLVMNIALRPLHHTNRAEPGLLEEAAALARRFGLPGAPVMVARDASRDDLWRGW
ncbi:hypothetical protein G5B40_05155 [Pikeienuella piscinae]|uniref:Uncharacterized protein n=1 Tax=Pikeienuella piscinae TaxID=2748098 RepID=A0A7L5BSY9_9RHOB|nr:hypothetical protein [Pikeienuella piscinae]QIE54890.1 hypothetical protein G5B40_05155 [Pikeienuella piscinae]